MKKKWLVGVAGDVSVEVMAEEYWIWDGDLFLGKEDKMMGKDKVVAHFAKGFWAYVLDVDRLDTDS